MDIKEIALKIGLQVFEEHPYDEGHVVSPSGYTWIDDKLIEFAEALISAHKAELLKEVGEPVLYAEFAEDGGWLGDASEYADHLEEPHALFTSDQVAAAILKATKPLEDEVKAANGECELFRKNGRIVDANKIVELRTQLAAAQEEWNQCSGLLDGAHRSIEMLEDQLATAEQRVTEACALLEEATSYTSCETWSPSLTDEINKFLKEGE